MTRIFGDPVARKLEQAEGYIMLGLPLRALEIIRSRADWATMRFEARLLEGEALRDLERYREALEPLEQAAALRPHDIPVALALGWCYKRTNRLAQAVDALERARRRRPDDPLLIYNLACYWSLAGNADRALEMLARAVELDPAFGRIAQTESDFDPVRSRPEFEQIIETKKPLTS